MKLFIKRQLYPIPTRHPNLPKCHSTVTKRKKTKKFNP